MFWVNHSSPSKGWSYADIARCSAVLGPTGCHEVFWTSCRTKVSACGHFNLVCEHIFAIFSFNVLFILSTCSEDCGWYGVCNLLSIPSNMYSWLIIFAVKWAPTSLWTDFGTLYLGILSFNQVFTMSAFLVGKASTQPDSWSTITSIWLYPLADGISVQSTCSCWRGKLANGCPPN